MRPGVSREKIAVSVIVPAYNVENTIIRCLDSLSNQTLKEFEIVLIDDGSKDKTLQLAQDYYKSCLRRLVILHQENKGPSAARNAGLEVASGEYVAFADADDEVEASTYEKMLKRARKYNADLVSCGRIARDANTLEVLKTVTPAYDVIYGSLSESPQIAKRVGPLMCDKLFRRSIIEKNHIRFDENLSHAEDYLFSSEFRLYVHCVAAVQENLYTYYLNNEKSLSKSNVHVLDIPVACRRIADLYQEKAVFDCTSPYLLYVFMGYYLRKRNSLPLASRIRREFIKEFKQLFFDFFPATWKKTFRRRLKKTLEREGILNFIKIIL